ncbi:MAG: sulfatase [Myxococcota bacterium]|nr:sulfatase [Myxococcota bacterium]
MQFEKRERCVLRLPDVRLAALAVLLAALGSLACSESESPAPRFNLVLISIDTLRADHVGAYGYPLPTTPHIDALAEHSLRLVNCVAHAPTTLASHASLLTSLLPQHHGASISRQSRLAEGAETLAEVLAEHGYRNASFNGGVQLDAAYGLDRGFEIYESAKSHDALAQALTGPEDRLRHGVERAIHWLDDTQGPFFVFLHSYEIHHPYTPDAEHLRLFDAGYAGNLPDHISVEVLERINAEPEPLPPEDLSHIVHAYDAELRSSDEAIGQLVAYLKARSLYDDTLIVVTSDHGEEFGEHGWVGWHAHSLYDELLLVPLIIKFPGSRLAGSVEKSQARGIDVAPTALAALGIQAPESWTGRDLGQELGAPSPAAVSMHDVPGKLPLWTLRSNGWKLKRVGGEALFDLEADPEERRNVAARHPEKAAAQRSLGSRLLNERRRPKDVIATLPAGTQEQLRELGYLE